MDYNRIHMQYTAHTWFPYNFPGTFQYAQTNNHLFRSQTQLVLHKTKAPTSMRQNQPTAYKIL